jgi:hypothetical protein
MLTRTSKNGRITACGAISGCNSDDPCVLRNYFQMIPMRLQIRGFTVHDSPPDKAAEAQILLWKAIEDGTLDLSDDNETIVPTKFEHVPNTWLALFEGKNTGKLATKLLSKRTVSDVDRDHLAGLTAVAVKLRIERYINIHPSLKMWRYELHAVQHLVIACP